jgi:Fe-S cluster assembly protein SufD
MSWSAPLRAFAAPSKRDEYWRYTDPAEMLDAVIPAAVPDFADGFAPLNPITLTFVDGVFQGMDAGQVSGQGSGQVSGLEIARLIEISAHPWATAMYGTLEDRGQIPVRRPLAALNSAQATDGVLIRVTGKIARPVSVVYIQKSTTSDAKLHHFIKIEQDAELTLIEQGSLAARGNLVLEVDIAKGGSFHHIRMQHHTGAVASHIFAHLNTEARFKSFTLTAGGHLTRNEAVIELIGDGASAHIAGAALGDGAVHHDDTLFITHQGRACESRQVFKKVLRNGAVGVFQGKILVKQTAQKTDGYQISQSLLLDGESQFLAKPELEIYADDVKCSHGSTSGAIDETALFYLQSRGVPKSVAQSLLVLAFLAEAVDEIADSAIADLVRVQLEAAL